METRSKIFTRLRITVSDEKNRERLEVLFTFISIILLSTFFLFPALRKISLLQQQANQLSTQQKDLQKTLKNYQEAAFEYSKLANDEESILAKIPLNPDPGSLINDITYYAVKSGISTSNISLSESDEISETYSFNIKGELPNILNFFLDIKKDDRFYIAKQLVLLGNNEGNNSQFNLKINLTGFQNESEK